MTVLFLVRHGVTDQTGKRLYGWTPGVHLSDRGREQADEVARRLAPLRLSAIYASPLERCRETAAPSAAETGLRVHLRRDLGEVDYGDWTNRPLAQLARTKLWRSVQQVPSQVTFPGGESLVHVQERASRAIGEIVASHPRGHVAVFSHGDPIRLLVSHLSGAHVDAFQRIVIDPGSISVVAIGGGAPRIFRVNDTGSLDGFVRRRRPGGNVKG
jgi:probable phosphomutase (TIGR03848 family)